MEKMIIEEIKKWIQQKSRSASHDYYHLIRVYNNVVFIADNENVSTEIKFIAQASALLHDIGHKKNSYLIRDEHHQEGNAEVITLLQSLKIDSKIIDRVLFCINNHRYSQDDSIGKERIELQILRDADRLDALGAIAIARTFSYDSERPIYVPDDAPKAVYDGISNSSINHIIEKILKLTPESFYMDSSRHMAEERLRFVQLFVDEFFREWAGVS